MLRVSYEYATKCYVRPANWKKYADHPKRWNLRTSHNISYDCHLSTFLSIHHSIPHSSFDKSQPTELRKSLYKQLKKTGYLTLKQKKEEDTRRISPAEIHSDTLLIKQQQLFSQRITSYAVTDNLTVP